MSCKISCYLSFKLNWDRENNIFSKSIITSQLAFTCPYSKQLSQKKMLIGASAWICCANFQKVNTWWGEVSVHFLSEPYKLS